MEDKTMEQVIEEVLNTEEKKSATYLAIQEDINTLYTEIDCELLAIDEARKRMNEAKKQIRSLKCLQKRF